MRVGSIRIFLFLIDEILAPLLGNLPMNFSNVLLWRKCKILCFNNRAIDVISPVLSHFLFIKYAKELCNKFGVDSQQIDKFEPEAKQLVRYKLNVVR